MTALAAWQNFYVIVGSSAGALIGLQFVVLSLIAARPPSETSADAGHAFATPTIVHFGAVLCLSGMMSAPWDTMGAVAFLSGLGGLCGVLYIVVVTRRMRAQSAYKPEFEDWLFHVLLPMAAHLMLVAAACVVRFRQPEALFGIGAAAMLLLFIGIHNAWDGVTYHVFVIAKREKVATVVKANAKSGRR